MTFSFFLYILLHFGGKSFSSSVDVAGAFSEHFQQLATLSNNPLFDAEYENQVTFDRLLIESIALQQEETIELVTLNEVDTIVKSFKSKPRTHLEYPQNT